MRRHNEIGAIECSFTGNFPGFFILGQSQTLPPDATKQVDKVFEKLDKQNSPGSALGVYKDGHIIYKQEYGMADLNDAYLQEVRRKKQQTYEDKLNSQHCTKPKIQTNRPNCSK